MQVTDDDVARVARLLWEQVYEESFRGKRRGRFGLTRGQLKQALGVRKLHGSTVERLQEEALRIGMAVVDLDDVFTCVDVAVLRKYRRPPRALFNKFFEPLSAEGKGDEGEREDE
jgi:hypothetical protein